MIEICPIKSLRCFTLFKKRKLQHKLDIIFYFYCYCIVKYMIKITKH